MRLDDLTHFCYAWLALALVVHVAMFRVTAPFGRHANRNWGPVMDNRLAWFLMELPSLLVMAGCLGLALSNGLPAGAWAALPFGLWIAHYAQRSLVYPLRIRRGSKPMPVAIAGMALLFNLVNAGINGWYLAVLAPPGSYGPDWLAQPRTLVGLGLFAVGFAVNQIADAKLIALRKPGETGYRIPRGFLFRFVSSPNLLGEVVEWGGFALLAWNLPALCFFAWTCANLIPRAKNHHDWYRRTFPDYPAERKAIFPYLF